MSARDIGVSPAILIRPCRRYYRRGTLTRKANSNEQTRSSTQHGHGCVPQLRTCQSILSGTPPGSHTGGMLMALLFGILLSFAAGALITALAFELFEDAYQRGGIERAAIGLFAGAVVFTGLSALLDRWAQPGKKATPTAEVQGSPKLDTDAAASDRPPRRRHQHVAPPAWRSWPLSPLTAFRRI